MVKPTLVYGATGAQGGAVVRALLADGARVRILTRSPALNPFAADERVEAVHGDFDDPASLRRASQGVGGVVLVMPLVFERERVVRWGRRAIDAAIEARAGTLVFNTSGVVPAAPSGVAALDIKLELEAYLQQADVPSVTLRSTVYMGNLAAPWSAPALVHQGVLAYPLPAEQRVSWISWEEAAGYALAALKRPDLAARKPVLCTGGPQALTGAQAADILGHVLGRSVAYVALPLAQFEAGLNASLGAPAGTEIARLYRWMSEPTSGNPLDVDLGPLRAELSVPQASLEQWARSVHWSQLAGVAA